MSSYQNYLTWPRSRILDAIYMLEARRANFQADANMYKHRCEAEGIDVDDYIMDLVADIVDRLTGQIAPLKEALEQLDYQHEQGRRPGGVAT